MTQIRRVARLVTTPLAPRTSSALPAAQGPAAVAGVSGIPKLHELAVIAGNPRGSGLFADTPPDHFTFGAQAPKSGPLRQTVSKNGRISLLLAEGCRWPIAETLCGVVPTAGPSWMVNSGKSSNSWSCSAGFGRPSWFNGGEFHLDLPASPSPPRLPHHRYELDALSGRVARVCGQCCRALLAAPLGHDATS
jgi:hypothetical protein